MSHSKPKTTQLVKTAFCNVDSESTGSMYIVLFVVDNINSSVMISEGQDCCSPVPSMHCF